MKREQIVEIINEFLVEELEVEARLTDEAHLKNDLGIDSLDFVDIVVVVDREFGFKIKQEEMVGIDTLGKFYDYIYSKVND
ncbi:MAG: phosphopantetheine-binding protein [Bacteroidales bacterium]